MPVLRSRTSASGWTLAAGQRRRHGLAGLLAAAAALLALQIVPAAAHSYPDPAVRTVLDGVTPTLPARVEVQVLPSVVDELVVTNPTSVPLEVLAVGGEPFLRISSAGVFANLASPDWYTTGVPEDGPPVPADVVHERGHGAPRWLLVSRIPSWAEFDPRLHPVAEVSQAQRAAGRDAVLATWRIPLRYGGQPVTATGHVLFTPVRGGFTVTLQAPSAGLQAQVLQGELPGLFLRPRPGTTTVVNGPTGEPFLRFDASGVQANTASPAWVTDQRARGRAVAAGQSGVHWVSVSRAPTYSWLDARLRYPADLPGAEVLTRPSPSVVQRWEVPVTVNGASAALRGTVTWVPRAVATRQVRALDTAGRSRSHVPWGVLTLAFAGAVVLATALVRRRRR